jgi:hypothetical protein
MDLAPPGAWVPLRAVNAEGERPIFSLDSWLEPALRFLG